MVTKSPKMGGGMDRDELEEDRAAFIAGEIGGRSGRIDNRRRGD